MSYTEIYSFGENGKVNESVEIKNAFRGAMAIWLILEKKYLPSMPKPMWVMKPEEEKEYYSRVSMMSDSSAMKEIWGLSSNEKMSRGERIVLMSTLDKVLIKKENIQELITSFDNFEGATSLKWQAEGIRILVKEDSVSAIGFNQTSVNGDTWANFNYNKETKEFESYNFLEQKEHWWLFDELDNVTK